MFMAGHPNLIVIKIKNNSDKTIDKVKFSFNNSLETSTLALKKIKPQNSKQTGISTININNNKLEMIFSDKRFLIKDSIPRDCRDTILITVTNINDNNDISYTVDIEDKK